MENYYETIDLLKGMIARPSFSREETAVADYLQTQWQQAGQKMFRKTKLFSEKWTYLLAQYLNHYYYLKIS